MAQPLSDLLIALKGDSSGFRSEMQAARQTATGTTLSIVRSFDQIEDKAKVSAKSLKAVRLNIAGLAGEAGGAVGKVASLGQTMATAFAGGPIIAGLTAVGLGISAVISKYREAQEKAAEAQQKQVDAWKTIEDSVQSTTEAMERQLRIKRLIAGGEDERTADTQDKINAKLTERKDLQAQIAKAIEAEFVARRRHDAAPGLGGLTRAWEEAKSQLDGYKASLKEVDSQLNSLGAFKGRQAAASAGLNDLAGKSGKPATTKAVDSSSAIRQAELAHFDLLIRKAQLLDDKEEEIKQKRLKALAEINANENLSAEDRKLALANVEAEATQAREALSKEAADKAKARAREQVDYEISQQARLASLTKSRLDDLEAQEAAEVETVRRKVEDKILAEEEGERRIQAIRARYLGATTRAMAEEAKTKKAEVDKALLDKQKLTGDAMQAGFAAGDSLIQGMKAAAANGDASAVAKGILSAAAGLLAAFGGPMGAGIGSGLNVFAGLFAEGGIIGGIGGPTDDRNLALVSRGEGILKASSMQRIGAPFFNRLNQDGVVDLSLLRKYATGGIIGGGSSTPALAGAGGPAQVFVTAFDPRSMLEVIGSALEPAQYRRGANRASSKLIAQQRRTTRAPRRGY